MQNLPLMLTPVGHVMKACQEMIALTNEAGEKNIQQYGEKFRGLVEVEIGKLNKGVKAIAEILEKLKQLELDHLRVAFAMGMFASEYNKSAEEAYTFDKYYNEKYGTTEPREDPGMGK